jgi:hypothetical protein
LSRIIKIESTTKQRNYLLKQIVYAIDWLKSNPNVNNTIMYDVAAYTAISLKEIFDIIEISVVAWEKKGYWVKADKYRMEWIWTINYSEKLKETVFNENHDKAEFLLDTIRNKLININVNKSQNQVDIWLGSRDKLANKK